MSSAFYKFLSVYITLIGELRPALMMYAACVIFSEFGFHPIFVNCTDIAFSMIYDMAIEEPFFRRPFMGVIKTTALTTLGMWFAMRHIERNVCSDSERLL